jgi:type I restriction enzyme S subunit
MSVIKKIPTGWGMTSLGEVADYINGRAFKPTEWVSSGTPIIRIQNLNDETALYNYSTQDFEDKYKVVNGDLLFAWSASLGAYIWKGKKAWLNQHIFKIMPKAFYDKSFLFYTLQKITAEIYAKTHGSGMVHVTKVKFVSTKIPLPPLPEQLLIVAKIEELFSSLDKGIENLKTAQRQLKVYRQAVLKWAFEGKLTNKDVKDGELPEEWVRVSLKELVDKISDGPFGSNLKTSDYVDNGVRVIRLENIGYMEFRNEFQSFVTKDKYETIKKHTVSKGDIIFSSFVSENIRAAILPDFIDRAINTADCFLVRPSEDKVTKKYLLYYFSTKEMYQQLIGEIHGATRPRINTTQLKSCQIPLAPLNEQQAIVAEIESRLSVCDKIEETIEQSLKQSESLRQSILKKAFEGKLVPQDPNDEPASVLLARIKDERESNNIETPKPRQARKTKKKAKL